MQRQTKQMMVPPRKSTTKKDIVPTKRRLGKSMAGDISTPKLKLRN